MEKNVVLVGSKPLSKYIYALTEALKSGKAVIKARGRHISKAVTLEEIVKNKGLANYRVTKIDISTVKLKSTDGTEKSVSQIEIHVEVNK